MRGFHKYVIFFYLVITMASFGLYAHFIVATPDQVIANEQGLFINVEGVLQPIESLNLANDGYLVAIPKVEADICPKCGHDTYTQGRYCTSCLWPIWRKASSQ